MPPTAAIMGVWQVGGITQRIARRSGASTGCSGLCPLPNTSQALPNLPNSIARQAGVRLTTLYRNPLYSAFAGSTVDGGFLGSIGKVWEILGVFGCIAANYCDSVRGRLSDRSDGSDRADGSDGSGGASRASLQGPRCPASAST